MRALSNLFVRIEPCSNCTLITRSSCRGCWVSARSDLDVARDSGIDEFMEPFTAYDKMEAWHAADSASELLPILTMFDGSLFQLRKKGTMISTHEIIINTRRE